MQITTSAPGKLILLGEYAVLEGAPAVVSAVNRRARVQVRSSPSWRINAPQMEIRDLTLAADGSLPDNLDLGRRTALSVYDAVRAAVVERNGPLRPLVIDIDSAAFYRRGGKLGLGSSAAVAVAATAAMFAAAGAETEREQIFSLAADAHRRAQGGRGSGVDVAASAYGGTLVHRQGQKPVAVPLPAGLDPVAVDTGISASTPSLLEAVYSLRRRDSMRFLKCMGRLAELAEQGADHLRRADGDSFLSIVEAYYHALAELGEAAGADIVSAVHKHLHGIVRGAGGSYKPSGAGRGDFGLAFAADREVRRSVVASVTRAGFCANGFSLATSGMDISGKR